MFHLDKKSMSMLSVLVLLIVVLAACTGPGQIVDVQDTGAAGAPAGTVTVVGLGEAFGQPDKAQAQVGVEIFAPTVGEATRENEAIVQRIMESLTAQGIAAEDIQTANYSLWAEQIYGERGPEGISGYRVTNQVSIVIRDINKISEVLAATTEAGANSIHGVFFSVSDPAALEADAREAAMADARERAESLANLGGVELSGIQSISEIVGSPPVLLERGGGGFAVADEAFGGPSISPGQLSHQVRLQVTFGLK